VGHRPLNPVLVGHRPLNPVLVANVKWHVPVLTTNINFVHAGYFKNRWKDFWPKGTSVIYFGTILTSSSQRRSFHALALRTCTYLLQSQFSRFQNTTLTTLITEQQTNGEVENISQPV